MHQIVIQIESKYMDVKAHTMGTTVDISTLARVTDLNPKDVESYQEMQVEVGTIVAFGIFLKEIVTRWNGLDDEAEQASIPKLIRVALESLQDAAALYVTEVFQEEGAGPAQTDSPDWNAMFAYLAKNRDDDLPEEGD